MAVPQISAALFQKIAQARAAGGRPVITDGMYLFLVQKIIFEPKQSGDCFIVELQTLEAQATQPGILPCTVGSEVGYVVNFDGKGKLSAPSNVKRFLLSLFGLDESAIVPEEFAADIAWICGPEQPATGMLIGATTYRKPIRSSPDKEFVAINWARKDQTAEEIAARRSKILAAQAGKAA